MTQLHLQGIPNNPASKARSRPRFEGDRSPANTFRQWQLREGDPLTEYGRQNLTNTDLLAHLIRDRERAVSLLERFSSIEQLALATVDELMAVDGIGKSTAEVIHTAFELGNRANAGERYPIVGSPADVYQAIWQDYRYEQQEIVKVLSLNTKRRITHIDTVFIGTLNACTLHPREILKKVIANGANSFILVHNHPSGDPTPSSEDIGATQRLRQAGELVQIPITDHIIIVGNGKYISLKEEGIL